ncbi:MAG TPA: YjbF family lipoprotein [Rhizomicrobium sp.]|jgi:hypothetical protein
MAERSQLVQWRYVAALAGLLGLSGCAGVDDPTNSDVGKIGALLYQKFSKMGADDSVQRERAAAVPFASMGVRLGSSSESMFVLATRTGDDLHWLGGKKLALTTRRGRIVQTVGFDHNLTGFTGLAPVPGKQTPMSTYLLDFAESSVYGVLVSCNPQDIGPESILIIGVAHKTRHVVEDCAASQLDWTFRNEFWADETGYVWKSIQYVAPDLDPLTIEALRPAAQ